MSQSTKTCSVIRRLITEYVLADYVLAQYLMNLIKPPGRVGLVQAYLYKSLCFEFSNYLNVTVCSVCLVCLVCSVCLVCLVCLVVTLLAPQCQLP